ncbi:alpha/beta hydrolase [Microbacterium deminutum]|uniref:Alpha/beta hydrolase n=1 Tax=Microbacterium deminutum TaxID=344164 RepID=A0ABN2RCE1_9MICO
MDQAISADGTRIAFEQVGAGPTVVIVGGAFSLAADGNALASALAEAGFRVVTIDRRGRGSSDDKRGSTPEDEADDLAAVIEAAGGEAIVLGHSSGAVLALYAAARGAPIRSLFLSEPPFRFGTDEPAADLPRRLQQLVDDGRSDEAVVTFQLEGVGLPPEMVEQIRNSDQFVPLVPLAQSTVYDATLTAQVSTPPREMLSVTQPVTILRGEQTFPILVAAADRLASEIDGAELVIVPESVMHRPDPVATARVVRERV